MSSPERDYSHRSLLDKLGVLPQHRAAIIGVNDAAFLADLKHRLAKTASATLRGRYDVVFVKIDDSNDLVSFSRAALHLRPDGAVWVFHPKGKGASPSDAEVRATGLAAGLVDNKISAYTQTHTATRYVVPVAKRASW